MRLGTILLASVTLSVTAASLVPSGPPQTKLSVTNLYDHPFDVDFPSGQLIRLDLRSGEFRIARLDGAVRGVTFGAGIQPRHGRRRRRVREGRGTEMTTIPPLP